MCVCTFTEPFESCEYCDIYHKILQHIALKKEGFLHIAVPLPSPKKNNNNFLVAFNIHLYLNILNSCAIHDFLKIGIQSRFCIACDHLFSLF